MDVKVTNECEYGKYNNLMFNQTEPLFLKPNGTRTRYPIGWNGVGRYIPGTLKVKYNGNFVDVTEEENGVFYNFSIAPSASDSINDFEVSYIARPLDYAFSKGLSEGGYEGEEYFLFPNWNNALNEGDAFWIGKWEASNNGNNIPQSKSGVTLWNNITRDKAIIACKSKGSKFGMVTNREWVSIARWCDHHNIYVKGNIYGNNTNNLDGDYTTLEQAGGGYNAWNGYHLVIGSNLPDTWSHNGKSNGIHNMVGNIFEFIDGLENRGGEIYIYDENDNYVDSGVSIAASTSSGTQIKDITNTSESILNEGIVNTVDTNGYVPSNLKGDSMWNNNGGQNILLRGGSSCDGLQAGLWAFNVRYVPSVLDGTFGFRLASKI